MKLYFPHAAFTLEDLLIGKINQKIFSESESYVLNFIKQWHSDKATFEFHTSGSTGTPKKIELTRNQLLYSAKSTIQHLFNEHPVKHVLLCINPLFIGGTQVIVRALIANADLYVVPPSSNVVEKFNESIDLMSMVPLQILAETKNPNPFEGINTVLIGGADLDRSLEMQLSHYKKTRFFHTYGMTETASHVALRKIGSALFEPMGDVELKLDDRNCLLISGTVTKNEWIHTNDVVELVEGGFIWKGRADWVINSGGIKIHPELVEQKLKAAFPDVQLMITSMPDERLGNRVVLVTSRTIITLINRDEFHPYEMPKEEFIITTWPLTTSGKMNRNEINEQLRLQ